MPPSRRLSDRIRSLCARASKASVEELSTVLSELQIAMAEYRRRIENRASAIAIFRWPDYPLDRRQEIDLLPKENPLELPSGEEGTKRGNSPGKKPGNGPRARN